MQSEGWGGGAGILIRVSLQLKDSWEVLDEQVSAARDQDWDFSFSVGLKVV